jgi:serine/threonine protein kinase
MGEVYRARDPRLNRDVAIKTSREQFNDRFLREARAVAALNHPNIFGAVSSRYSRNLPMPTRRGSFRTCRATGIS